MAENVYSSARILKDDKKVEKFELSNFLKNKLTPKEESNEFLELKLKILKQHKEGCYLLFKK